MVSMTGVRSESCEKTIARWLVGRDPLHGREGELDVDAFLDRGFGHVVRVPERPMANVDYGGSGRGPGGGLFAVRGVADRVAVGTGEAAVELHADEFGAGGAAAVPCSQDPRQPVRVELPLLVRCPLESERTTGRPVDIPPVDENRDSAAFGSHSIRPRQCGANAGRRGGVHGRYPF